MKNKEFNPLSSEKAPAENGGYLRKRSNRVVRKSTKPAAHWRRWIFSFFALLSLAAVSLSFYHLYRHIYYSDYFQLRQVIWNGNKNAKLEPLQTMMMEKFSGNLMRLSLREVRLTLELNPWILHARIRRILPDTLKIDLTEREPIALAAVENSIYIVSRDGVVLDRYSSRYGQFSYPIIHGLETDAAGKESNKQRVALFLQAMEDLDSKGGSLSANISEVDLTDSHNLVIIPKDETVRILLGSEDFSKRYQTHLRRLNAFRQVKEKAGPLEAVDLRFNGQVIYQRVKGGSPGQAITTSATQQ